MSLLEKEYREIGYSPAREYDSITFDVAIGKSKVKIVMDISTIVVDEELVVDQLQCTLSQECGYKQFSSDVHELGEAQKKVERVLRKHVTEFMEDISLVCELKELYELTGILSDNKIGSLRSTIEKEKIRFDLSENMLIVYGKEINAEMLSLMKRMITVYF